MQCVTPMFRYYKLGEYKKGKIIPRAEVMHELKQDPNTIRKCLDIANKNAGNYRYETIPCQHCWACKLNYSAEWATRIMLEAKDYEHNYYITLTYDDEHVPILDSIEYDKYTEDKQLHTAPVHKHIKLENDGTWGYSLHTKDMEDFIHDLRQYMDRDRPKKGKFPKHQGIKYFYCGEYGTKLGRPHYHIILMNCPLDINEFYSTKIDKNYKAHWKSKELEKIWTKGFVDVAELEWSCAAYVARYCTKKLDFNLSKEEIFAQGKWPEYIRMSKGIGFKYYQEYKKNIYKDDEMIMRTVKGNIGRMKPPKAFDRLYKEQDPEGFEKIKKSRLEAKRRADEMIQEVSDYTDQELLKIKASNVETKMSMLPRAGDF